MKILRRTRLPRTSEESTTDRSDSYSFTFRLIHWLTAFLVFSLLFVGFIMVDTRFSQEKLLLYALHKSFGLLVLGLVVFRIIVKSLSVPVRTLKTSRMWERVLAKITHVLLYVILFSLPLSGWIMSSAGEFPVSFFGLPVPSLMGKDSAVFSLSRMFHTSVAIGLVCLIGLHVAGALKHHILDRDTTLMRMTGLRIREYSYRASFLVGMFFLIVYGGLLFLVTQKLYSQNITMPESRNVQHERKNYPHSGVDSLNSTPFWIILKDKSRLSFEAVQYGQPFGGLFTFDGEILFDPDHLEDSRIAIRVDIASIQTGSSERDSQALSSDWFDASKFSKAFFEAARFERLEAARFLAYGTLTVRSVRKEIQLPFSLRIFEQDGQRVAEVEAQISLNRLDFGIGQGEWQSTDTIGEEVKLSITVRARQEQGASHK